MVLVSDNQALVLFEAVQNNVIASQQTIIVNGEGIYNVDIGVTGSMYLRVRVLNNHSLVRILEVHKRKWIFKRQKTLIFSEKKV